MNTAEIIAEVRYACGVVILEIGEQSSARDENLRQSADDGADY